MIVNEVNGVCRVVYDSKFIVFGLLIKLALTIIAVTSKPPGTIEME
jgi:GMP synthase PP-ATPase subunit